MTLDLDAIEARVHVAHLPVWDWEQVPEERRVPEGVLSYISPWKGCWAAVRAQTHDNVPPRWFTRCGVSPAQGERYCVRHGGRSSGKPKGKHRTTLIARIRELEAALRPLAEHDKVEGEVYNECAFCDSFAVDGGHESDCPVLAARAALGITTPTP